MKKIILVLLLCGLMMTAFASCEPPESPPSTDEESVMEQITEIATESADEPIMEPEYFSELVCPDTMTDKEKSDTTYRSVTITHPDAACKIGEYYASYDTSKVFKELLEIEDNIRELKIYDEQLDTNFLAHIILPPDYDENTEYPVFLMTDSQYWFKCLPNMYNLIRDGETAPVIIVTLGNDYDSDGYSDDARFDKFVLAQDKLLDFITNDLMQLISVNYKVDASRSVFFGHSLGGLFSHYALCNSDKYDYQPFANYIIGSPAFWTYYFSRPYGFDISSIPDPHAFEREFDYFDRNGTMDKNVFICAGDSESYEFSAPDVATIPQEAQSLYDRLVSHGVNAEIMLYEGKRHMNYVEDMFNEYMKKTFPPENKSETETQ